ncbi:MAG TPA: DUF3099 domain-containing protein [Dermatophilaceae bacterium]|nr:DUF3099 domain-containing protein [Dermatophilaceae bacterium]
MKKRVASPAQPVYSVTSAPPSLRDDQQHRMRRYLVSMGIRTACFLLAVLFLVGLHWTVAGWAMVIGAVVLPYIAVVMANATSARFPGEVGAVTPPTRFDKQIGPGPASSADPTSRPR